jgi:amidase
MARNVEDLALLLPLLAGPDGADPFVHGLEVGDPGAVPMGGLRVAVCAADGPLRVGEATASALRAAGDALAELGGEVEAADVPEVPDATELFFALMAADGGAAARADVAAAGGRHAPSFARLLDELRPLAVDAAGLLELLRRLASVRERLRGFLSRYDVALLPVAPGPAPLHGHVPGEELGLEGFAAFAATQALSLAGVPVTVVRAGWDGHLPIGVQVVGSPGRDHVCLAAAAALEGALGGYAGAPEAVAVGGGA